jgi:hypothetical protein
MLNSFIEEDYSASEFCFDSITIAEITSNEARTALQIHEELNCWKYCHRFLNWNIHGDTKGEDLF